MRITKLVMRNYRQYIDCTIDFEKKARRDLHVVVGKNGVGKTNILNAINWCLYGNEPHLAKDSEGMPVGNVRVLREAGQHKKVIVSVELHICLDKSENPAFFVRNAEYRLKAGEETPVKVGEDFSYFTRDNSGNTKIYRSGEASTYVQHFVPITLREFFFFDGEQLSNYFKEATGQKISNAIFELSQVDLLNRISARMERVLSDFRKDASANSPQIDEARKKYENDKEKLDQNKEELKTCQDQIAAAKDEIKRLQDALADYPNVEAMVERRKQLDHKLEDIDKAIKMKKLEKASKLYTSSKFTMHMPAIEQSIGLIDEKIAKGEVPPPIDPSVLEGVLSKNVCKICGAKIDTAAASRIKTLLKEIRTSKKVGQAILSMNPYLHRIKEELPEIIKEIKILGKDIADKQKDHKFTFAEKEQIQKKLEGFNEEKIVAYSKDLKKYEKLRDDKTERAGFLKSIIIELERNANESKKDWDEELEKNKKSEGIRNRIRFCEKAVQITTAAKNNILNDIRAKIEIETTNYFTKLIWKKDYFGDVSLDSNYYIHLFHKMGMECLGTISAGERGLLAFAFTLAMHKISGFDSPIIIDSPVHRISDENRSNIANVFAEVGEGKQIILLFTPSEYSSEVSTVLSNKANQMMLKMDVASNSTCLESYNG